MYYFWSPISKFNSVCVSPNPCYANLFLVLLRLLSIAVVAIGLNMYSTQWANKVQVTFSAAKLFALIVIVLGGIAYMAQGRSISLPVIIRLKY